MADATKELTFWEHLEELRGTLLRSIAVVVVVAAGAFLLKEQLFEVVLAPRTPDFLTYRLIGVETMPISLMNTGLTEQFMVHLRTSLYVGLLMASPYVLFEIFRFVSPGLYRNERRAALWLVVAAYAMFILGTMLNYLLIFPFTLQFLGTYQVSPDVANMLTLQSYIDTLISMSLVMGVVFELPVACTLLGRMGFIDRQLMTAYRRHAIVAILTLAAVITPTTDVLTLLIVSTPIWMLYEVSVWLVPARK